MNTGREHADYHNNNMIHIIIGAEEQKMLDVIISTHVHVVYTHHMSTGAEGYGCLRYSRHVVAMKS